ncbi:MAG: TenA family protein [Wolbachia sp.]
MTKLLEKVWKESEHICQDVINHPFNQELTNGTLSRERFCYYLEQDSIFVKDCFNIFTMIAARSQNAEYAQQLLKFSSDCIAEQQTLLPLLKRKFNFKETGKLAPATLAYTSYLRYISVLESFEVAISAVLPCFLVYREVGRYIAKNSVDNNPFVNWIEAYSSEEFLASVDKAIYIFDYIAEQTTETIKQQMCDAFYKSTVLQWHFCHDIYEIRVFDNTKS